MYRDYREMLEKEENNIDSVSVGIPDHMHAPVAMTAIQKGEHVFCEKPLTKNVYEARQLTPAAAPQSKALRRRWATESIRMISTARPYIG